MKLLYQGAESKIFLEENKVTKDRIKKSYRIPELDITLRKTRTRTEERLINEARRNGIAVPIIRKSADYSIEMDFIDGKLVKDIFNGNGNVGSLAYNIGINIGKLHSAGIVHGDLTTSNMILEKGKVYFIDFGLGFFSKRIEDLATDLAVLKEAIKATHFNKFGLIWDNIVMGYSDNTGKAKDKVFKALDSIEKRGRYVKKR